MIDRVSSSLHYPNNFSSTAIKRFKQPRGLRPYLSGYIQFYSGAYKIEILDESQVSTGVYTKEFTRFKKDANQSGMRFRFEGKQTKKQIEAQKKMMANFKAAQLKADGGFKNDIVEIIGEYHGYIFLSVSSKDSKYNEGNILIDVISPNFDYYSQIDLGKVPDLKWTKIENGKFIFEMENDDDGPYVKVFDIEIKDELNLTHR